MKKIIKLTETQLHKIVKRVLSEAYEGGLIQQGDAPCEIWCKVKLAKTGSNGDVVKMIQHLLAANGFNEKYVGGGMNSGCDGKWQHCDGKYRKHTKDAVLEFQRKYSGLINDGIVGFDTLTVMCKNLKPSNDNTGNFGLCKQQCKCDDIEQRPPRLDNEDPIVPPGGGGDEGSWWDIIKNPITDPIGHIGDIWDIIIGDNPKKHCEQVNYCVKHAMGKDSKNWEFFLRCIGKKIDHPITNPNPKKGCTDSAGNNLCKMIPEPIPPGRMTTAVMGYYYDPSKGKCVSVSGGSAPFRQMKKCTECCERKRQWT